MCVVRTRMKPPQVAPYGSRKTIFMNFVEICSTMYAPHPPRILLWLAGIYRAVAPPGFREFAAALAPCLVFFRSKTEKDAGSKWPRTTGLTVASCPQAPGARALPLLPAG